MDRHPSFLSARGDKCLLNDANGPCRLCLARNSEFREAFGLVGAWRFPFGHGFSPFKVLLDFRQGESVAATSLGFASN